MTPRDAGVAILEAPVIEPDSETILDDLAKLSPLEYEKARKDTAQQMGIRASVLDGEVERRRPATARPDEAAGSAMTLDDPKPWPHHVDGSAVLDEVVSTLGRLVVMPSGSPEAAALWVTHAHAHDAAFCSPILAITSP